MLYHNKSDEYRSWYRKVGYCCEEPGRAASERNGEDFGAGLGAWLIGMLWTGPVLRAVWTVEGELKRFQKRKTLATGLEVIPLLFWPLSALDLRICLKSNGLILWAETVSRRQYLIRSSLCFVETGSHCVALAGLELAR